MFVDEKRDGESQVPVKPIDEVSRHLLRAADIIRHRGHAQWTLEDTGGGVCLMGSIIAAQRGEVYDTFSGNLTTMNAFTRVHAQVGNDICTWNNQPGRTADDVINALEAAANVR